jgi:hypothetical protein
MLFVSAEQRNQNISRLGYTSLNGDLNTMAAVEVGNGSHCGKRGNARPKHIVGKCQNTISLLVIRWLSALR